MLYSLNCRCAGSEPRMRTFLHECGYSGWQTIPATKGRSECLALIDRFPKHPELEKLKNHLKTHSSWSIVLGTDGTDYQWSDIGHSKLKEKLDAEIIVKDFGNVQ